MKKIIFSIIVVMLCGIALSAVYIQKIAPQKPALTSGFSTSALSGRNITICVRDESGNAIVGVSIVVKGTTTGTITGVDGCFNLTVNDSDILVFSFLGYKTIEVPASSIKPGTIIIMYEDTNE